MYCKKMQTSLNFCCDKAILKRDSENDVIVHCATCEIMRIVLKFCEIMHHSSFSFDLSFLPYPLYCFCTCLPWNQTGALIMEPLSSGSFERPNFNSEASRVLHMELLGWTQETILELKDDLRLSNSSKRCCFFSEELRKIPIFEHRAWSPNAAQCWPLTLCRGPHPTKLP